MLLLLLRKQLLQFRIVLDAEQMLELVKFGSGLQG